MVSKEKFGLPLRGLAGGVGVATGTGTTGATLGPGRGTTRGAAAAAGALTVGWRAGFEVIPADDQNLPTELGKLPDQPPPPGVVVRVRDVNGDPAVLGFTVRIEATVAQP